MIVELPLFLYLSQPSTRFSFIPLFSVVVLEQIVAIIRVENFLFISVRCVSLKCDIFMKNTRMHYVPQGAMCFGEITNFMPITIILHPDFKIDNDAYLSINHFIFLSKD